MPAVAQSEVWYRVVACGHPSFPNRAITLSVHRLRAASAYFLLLRCTTSSSLHDLAIKTSSSQYIDCFAPLFATGISALALQQHFFAHLPSNQDALDQTAVGKNVTFVQALIVSIFMRSVILLLLSKILLFASCAANSSFLPLNGCFKHAKHHAYQVHLAASNRSLSSSTSSSLTKGYICPLQAIKSTFE